MSMGGAKVGVQFCGSPWLRCGEWIPGMGKVILGEKAVQGLAGIREVLVRKIHV